MDRAAKIEDLARLFEQTDQAWQQARSATDGDWAHWYADYLVDRLPQHLTTNRSRTHIIRCLVAADDEHQARFAEQPWHDVFAEHFMECYCASDSPRQDQLALYHFERCPYCVIVRRVIDELGLDVELRDVLREPAHRAALMQARGRGTVPVLRITGPDGSKRWMPESRDIIMYLRENYGG